MDSAIQYSVPSEYQELPEFMQWTVPKFSKSEVDAAGAFLFGKRTSEYLLELNDFEKVERAFEVIGNWRSAHNYPLNIFQKNLRKRARKIEATSIVAQRIKRISSIDAKISRYPTMRLSMMQDIGGCRAVMSDVDQVQKLVRSYKQSDIKHILAQEDDYIEKPKKSGYRGVHLIYKYFSDKIQTFNGLKVEVQIRTALQHA